ncbi:hypothetical protein GQX74_015275 [Glossina fuscipes]|nr:hypothetical protein GQX74_015275 [Glossina fuscipes]
MQRTLIGVRGQLLSVQRFSILNVVATKCQILDNSAKATIAANYFSGLRCVHFEARLCNNRLKQPGCGLIVAHSIFHAIFEIICSFFWQISVCLASLIRYPFITVEFIVY